ncbi:GALA protein [Ralstonia solanacearum species complex bacterium KE056]|uniref:GALA protein n=1 Tax=Ralstonia solanacearum species complex bacterium KE056 TaxID=3119585 RepID=UPI002FC369D5
MAAPVSTRNAPLPSAPATADAGTPRGPNPSAEPAYTPTRSSAGVASSPLGGLAALRLGPATASPSSGPRILPPAPHGDPRTAALPRPIHLQIHDRRALSGLHDHPSLESVHLKGDFTLEDLKALPATLRHLDLSECTGSAKSRQAIAYLAGLQLESLNVTGAEIGNDGAQLLAANPSLKWLNAANGGIGADGARMLAASPVLMSLDLTQNAIGDAGVQALAGSRSLRYLAVRNCLVTDASTEALALNTKLTSLDLGNLVTETGNEAEQAGYDLTANNITAPGAWMLAQSRSLKALSVQGNDQCGDDGVLALARNRTLTALNVAFTNMTSASAKALADNPVLTTLSVRWNYGLDDAGMAKLARSRSLTSLDARDTGMSKLGALALADNARIRVLHDHPNLTRATPGPSASQARHGSAGAHPMSAEGPANSARADSTLEGVGLIGQYFDRMAREYGLNVQAPQEMSWPLLRPSAWDANHGNAGAHDVSAESLASSRMAAEIREGLGLIDQYVDRMEQEYGLPVRAPAAQPDGTAPEGPLSTLPADVLQTIADHAGPRVRRALTAVNKPLREAALAATKHLTIWDDAAFSRLRNYPALESLSFHGPLSLADLRALPPSVRHLDLSGCTGSAISEAGLAYLAQLPLASLNLSDAGIDDRGAQVLATSASLTSLNLSGNGIDNAGAQALGRNTVLTTLDISANPIRNAGVQALADSKSLTSLAVRGIGIGDTGIQALAANTVLRSLDISRNDLSNASATALGNNQTLTSLKANDCGLTNAMAEQIARIRSLDTLEVSSNSIGDTGVPKIARNATLRSLNLSRNPITLQGLRALEISRTLKSLDMSHIQCGDQGALLLSKNPALTSLTLGFCGISSAGAQRLAANRTLVSLDLRGNTLDLTAAWALAHATPLASLNVSDCKLDDAAACALAESSTLTSLDVSENRLSSRAAWALAANTVLTELSISHNRIGPDGAQALSESTSLTFLDARSNGIGEAGARLLEDNTRMRGTPQNPHFLAQDVLE